jgi:hypothetical protein
MDKYTVQMMHDNKWMAEKVVIIILLLLQLIDCEKHMRVFIFKIRLYLEESSLLNEETSKLEKDNIGLMTNLFDCSVSDLRVIK